MPKSILAATLVLLLVGLSCRLVSPAAPTPALIQTLPPEPPPFLPPAATPLPTPTTPTATPVPPRPTATLPPPVLDDLRLIFWDVQVSYDPAVWQLASSDYPFITHRSLAGCQITEQGPTEPPMNTTEVQLGEVTYALAGLEIDGQPVDWYMAINGPQGPFPGGLPTLLVSAPTAVIDACRADAQVVLATMRITGGP